MDVVIPVLWWPFSSCLRAFLIRLTLLHVDVLLVRYREKLESHSHSSAVVFLTACLTVRYTVCLCTGIVLAPVNSLLALLDFVQTLRAVEDWP